MNSSEAYGTKLVKIGLDFEKYEIVWRQVRIFSIPEVDAFKIL